MADYTSFPSGQLEEMWDARLRSKVSAWRGQQAKVNGLPAFCSSGLAHSDQNLCGP